MVCQYKKICKKFQCRVKVFTQMPSELDKKIGTPDMVVLFTNTASHKMIRCATEGAKRQTHPLSEAIQAVGMHSVKFYRAVVCVMKCKVVIY